MYHVFNFLCEPLTCEGALLEFETPQSAERFMRKAKQIFGFRVADYQISCLAEVSSSYIHRVNATNLIPAKNPNGGFHLVEA